MAGGGVGVAVGGVVECGIGGSGVPCSELQSTTGEFVNSRHCHPSWGDSFISGANSCASHAYSLVLTAQCIMLICLVIQYSLLLSAQCFSSFLIENIIIICFNTQNTMIFDRSASKQPSDSTHCSCCVPVLTSAHVIMQIRSLRGHCNCAYKLGNCLGSSESMLWIFINLLKYDIGIKCSQTRQFSVFQNDNVCYIFRVVGYVRDCMPLSLTLSQMMCYECISALWIVLYITYVE